MATAIQDLLMSLVFIVFMGGVIHMLRRDK